MPAPVGSAMYQLACNELRNKSITLPLNWSQPTGEAGDQYNDAFSESEKNTMGQPMGLFSEASSNKYHTDTQKQIHTKFDTYLNGICNAICSAIATWHSATIFVGTIVNATAGQAIPSNLFAAPMTLNGLIMASGPKTTPNELKYTTAIATAIEQGWAAWQTGYTVSLQYPAFAAFPGPVTPPMPNIPVPLASGSSAGDAALKPQALSGSMMGALGDPQAQHAKDLFDSIAAAFDTTFTQYKASTQILDQAMGPIPTFAPPFVPVGPVVMGTSLGIPSCLI